MNMSEQAANDAMQTQHVLDGELRDRKKQKIDKHMFPRGRVLGQRRWSGDHQLTREIARRRSHEEASSEESLL
jgi:hypothetical protein